jgi:hypothetical protein
MEARMHRTARFISIAMLATGLGTLGVHAQSENTQPPTALPQATQFGAVSVISGGVDLDEAQRLKQASARYPLAVVFSVPGGNYAVPQQFTLTQRGNVLAQISSAGPWLLIDLPPGAYTLQARVDDRVFERTVNVSRRGNTVYWQLPHSNG